MIEVNSKPTNYEAAKSMIEIGEEVTSRTSSAGGSRRTP